MFAGRDFAVPFTPYCMSALCISKSYRETWRNAKVQNMNM